MSDQSPVPLAEVQTQSAVAMLERQLLQAPAPPPPRGPPGRVGGGGDGDGGFVVRKLTDAETEEVLEDWLSKRFVYELEAGLGESDRAARYTNEFARIQKMATFHNSRKARADSAAKAWATATFGLYRKRLDRESGEMTSEVIALASAQARPTFGGSLAVSHLVFNPRVVGDDKSTAREEMLHALELVAKRVGYKLDLVWLSEQSPEQSSDENQDVAADDDEEDDDDDDESGSPEFRSPEPSSFQG